MLPQVAAINELEPQMEALSDEQLRAKTDEFRQQLNDGKGLDASRPSCGRGRHAAVASPWTGKGNQPHTAGQALEKHSRRLSVPIDRRGT